MSKSKTASMDGKVENAELVMLDEAMLVFTLEFLCSCKDGERELSGDFGMAFGYEASSGGF